MLTVSPTKMQSVDESPELLFHILYEDGDEEDLDISEIQNLVTAASVKAVCFYVFVLLLFF